MSHLCIYFYNYLYMLTPMRTQIPQFQPSIAEFILVFSFHICNWGGCPHPTKALTHYDGFHSCTDALLNPLRLPYAGLTPAHAKLFSHWMSSLPCSESKALHRAFPLHRCLPHPSWALMPGPGHPPVLATLLTLCWLWCPMLGAPTLLWLWLSVLGDNPLQGHTLHPACSPNSWWPTLRCRSLSLHPAEADPSPQEETLLSLWLCPGAQLLSLSGTNTHIVDPA